jgi:hypothetical protein
MTPGYPQTITTHRIPLTDGSAVHDVRVAYDGESVTVPAVSEADARLLAHALRDLLSKHCSLEFALE